MSENLPETAQQRIAEHVEGIIDDLLYRVMQDEEPARDFDTLRETIDETGDDGTGAIYLDTRDWFALVAEVAADMGWEKPDVAADQLEQWLESSASAAVIHLAQNDAREVVDELESFMDDHGFKLSELRTENRFGWAAHRAEREDGDAQVYEYRKVEGEINVDVYQYDLGDNHTIYFERYVDR